jgi:single-strand DNA-binding protein
MFIIMQMNRVEIAGHLAKRPEVRYLPSGTPVANARLGQTYRFQDGNQQWQERTNWHSLSFYGDLSRVAQSFEKGENIFVEGAIEQREFTPKDGSKRVVNEIIVRHCHLIAPARGTALAAAAAQPTGLPGGESLPDFEQAPNRDDDWPVR